MMKSASRSVTCATMLLLTVFIGVLDGTRSTACAQTSREDQLRQIRQLFYEAGQRTEALDRAESYIRGGFDPETEAGRQVLQMFADATLGESDFRGRLQSAFRGQTIAKINATVDYFRNATEGLHERALKAREDYLTLITVQIFPERTDPEVGETISFHLKGYNGQESGREQIAGQGRHMRRFGKVEVQPSVTTLCDIKWTDRDQGLGTLTAIQSGAVTLKVYGEDNQPLGDESLQLNIGPAFQLGIDPTNVDLLVGVPKGLKVTVSTGRPLDRPLVWRTDPDSALNAVIRVMPRTQNVASFAEFEITATRSYEGPIRITFERDDGRGAVTADLKISTATIAFTAHTYTAKRGEKLQVMLQSEADRPLVDIAADLDYKTVPERAARLEPIPLVERSDSQTVEVRGFGPECRRFLIKAHDAGTGLSAETIVLVDWPPSKKWALVATGTTITSVALALVTMSDKKAVYEDGELAREAGATQAELNSQYNDEVDALLLRERLLWVASGVGAYFMYRLWTRYFAEHRSYEGTTSTDLAIERDGPRVIVTPDGAIGVAMAF